MEMNKKAFTFKKKLLKTLFIEKKRRAGFDLQAVVCQPLCLIEEHIYFIHNSHRLVVKQYLFW